ncbi:MAG TPA: branched-chain amino acid ABC transporter permease [Syntrophales bacterium]|nr:branched-chain amino acid ABC transporter permease [Syntrophales bacterium]HOM06569.1 branched-chain amino acid ABC transporter permease [Syntrophales bacterium]HON99648.1 branched-chain amino acid ABC transporter permease [Syntrophales bacterium]HPC00681.1 branched-chain amino acid ABC transporter permease [Syntrophales bacterium]HPQ06169.1 branched-chain amino acid ABC transporter permease [Syntrophales bacterium]
MDPVLVIQSLISGVMMGMVYALLGVGFSLTWGVMHVIHISHAVFGLLGAYFAYTLLTLYGVDPVVSAMVSTPLLFIVACAVYQVLIRPLTKAREMVVASMILTFGLAIILENLLVLVWKADPRLLTPSYASESWIIGPFYLQYPHLIGFALSLVGISSLYVFLKKTTTGMAVRAAWQNQEAARLYGVNLFRISMITFALAVSTAGAGGISLALLYSFEPHSHNLWLIYLFLVVIVGGVGNVIGTALAGLIIGVITGLSMAFLPYQWVNLITFGLLMVFLIFRPHGLFGEVG